MSGSVINPSIGSPQPLQNQPGGQPPEGPKTLPVSLPFTSQVTSFTLNTQQLLAQGAMTAFQSLFVNNSNNSQSLSVSVNISGSTVVIPAGECQWVALLAPSNSTITFQSTGAVTVACQITNFFVQPTGAGGGSSGGSYNSSGQLLVSDPNIEACINNDVLSTAAYALAGSDVLVPQRSGTLSYVGRPTGSSNYHQMATGAPYFFITGVIIMVSGDLALPAGTPGNTLVLSLYESNGNEILQVSVNVGTGLPAGNLTLLALTGMNYITTAANGAVNFVMTDYNNSAVVPTAGACYCTIFGGPTAL